MLERNEVERLAKSGEGKRWTARQGQSRVRVTLIVDEAGRDVAWLPGPGHLGEGELMAAAPKLAETALYWMAQAQQLREEALAWHQMVARIQERQREEAERCG